MVRGGVLACRIERSDPAAGGDSRISPYLESIRDPRAAARRTKAIPGRAGRRHGNLLSGAAAPSAVLRLSGLRRRRLSDVRRSGAAGSGTTDLPPAGAGPDTVGGRSNRCVLRLTPRSPAASGAGLAYLLLKSSGTSWCLPSSLL